MPLIPLGGNFLEAIHVMHVRWFILKADVAITMRSEALGYFTQFEHFWFKRQNLRKR